MVQTMSAVTIILLVQVMLGCLGQVLLDEDIDDTSDMDGGYGDVHRFNGGDWGNGRHNELFPDNNGRHEFVAKSPYDDDDLDHRGHEHSEVLQNGSTHLTPQNLFFSPLLLIMSSYHLWGSSR